MAQRPKLTLFSSSDGRTRLHLRLVERDGQPAIAYRTNPGAIEKYAASIELAMGEALGESIGEPAVLIWEGIK